jgi:hypothetical protein
MDAQIHISWDAVPYSAVFLLYESLLLGGRFDPAKILLIYRIYGRQSISNDIGPYDNPTFQRSQELIVPKPLKKFQISFLYITSN